MRSDHFEGGSSHVRTHQEFIGEDVERAYADLFGTKRIGGVKDGGRDVMTNDPEVPYLQIKSSWYQAREFLGRAVSTYKRFTPVCIGEPGTAKEVLESVRKYGGWVEKEMPMREEILDKIKTVRDTIEKQNRGRYGDN